MNNCSRQLLIATRNLNKVREIALLLTPHDFQLRSLTDFPDITEVAETSQTFSGNALLKAHGYAAQTGLPTLADDSGLEVDALGRQPGVHSARYGGADASDSERCGRLLAALSHISHPDDRRARFVCVIAVVNPTSKTERTWQGVCAGRIAAQAHGANGFGYDPIFIPDNYEQTFGELPTSIKQQISHRAHALSLAKDVLAEML